MLIRIQFRQPHSRLQLERGLLECRRHHLAWPAPRGPKIHYQRNVAAADMCLEARVRKFDRMTGKKRLPAFTATRVFGKARGRYPVHRCAIGTNNVRRFGHIKRVHKTDCSNLGARQKNSRLAGKISIDATTISYYNCTIEIDVILTDALVAQH